MMSAVEMNGLMLTGSCSNDSPFYVKSVKFYIKATISKELADATFAICSNSRRNPG